MAAFTQKPRDEQEHAVTSRHLDDEATHAPAHDEVPQPSPAPTGKPDPMALMPWMDGDLGPPPTPSLPLTSKDQLEVVESRSRAEKLLTGKDTEGGHAMQAVELMSGLPDAEREKVIDSLSPQAFQAMFDEIPPDDRTRFGALVDASQNPQRKLAMWKDMHFAQVQSDAATYSHDTGNADEPRTDAQNEAKVANDRRDRRVADDKKEVDAELARLAALDKQGKLTVADIDEMRGRKDRELAIEQRYNVDLTADPNAKWSTDELASMDAAFAQLPPDHVHGEAMVPGIVRRQPVPGISEGGEYTSSAGTPQIDLYDDAHKQPGEGVGKPRSRMVDPALEREHGKNIDAFEYSVTHEMGHRWAAQNHDVFKKFERIAGWRELDDAGLTRDGLPASAIDELKSRNHGGTLPESGWGGKDIEQGGKHYTSRSLAPGKFESVDSSAFPTDMHGADKRDDKWWYGRWNSQEHFAELYARPCTSRSLSTPTS